MTVPVACIAHLSAGRIRLRIPAMRGDLDFFPRVLHHFAVKPEITPVAFNPVSGGLLFSGANLSLDAVADVAASAGLFVLAGTVKTPVPLARRVAEPIRVIDRTIRSGSEGVLDLSGAFFILMLFFGIFELVRGNFRTPPWYTLFWYAFGVFSKSVADHYAQIDLPD
jgi:hypothetical protein